MTSNSANPLPMIESQAPSPERLRECLYQGSIYKLPPSRESLQLVARVRAVLSEVFGEPVRMAQYRLAVGDYLTALRLVRSRVAEIRPEPLLPELGLSLQDYQVDTLRLRGITHLGHRNPLARPAYLAHRDTWFANPQAQLNLWIPIHDIGAGESFGFYPECFARALPNNSQDFDFDRWLTEVGWQSDKPQDVSRYPTTSHDLDAEHCLRFTARRGERLLFSAQHLHQTLPIESGLTRFSLDFRFVHRQDRSSGRGPANLDNRSTGSSMPVC